MLELPIQGKTTLLPIVAEQRSYGVHLTERGAGRYLVTEGGDKTTRLLEGQAGQRGSIFPTTSPFSPWEWVTGSRFCLNLLMKIHSSEPLDCGGNALVSGEFGKNSAPTSHSSGPTLSPRLGPRAVLILTLVRSEPQDTCTGQC